GQSQRDPRQLDWQHQGPLHGSRHGLDEASPDGRQRFARHVLWRELHVLRGQPRAGDAQAHGSVAAAPTRAFVGGRAATSTLRRTSRRSMWLNRRSPAPALLRRQCGYAATRTAISNRSVTCSTLLLTPAHPDCFSASGVFHVARDGEKSTVHWLI